MIKALKLSRNALLVLTLDPDIRAFLKENDPQALRQAEAAITEADAALTKARATREP